MNERARDVRWHYRIVRHADNNLSLCEVYYDKDDAVTEIVRNPLFAAYTAGGENRDSIIRALRNALRDARQRTILDE